jgi:hypothetical protein
LTLVAEDALQRRYALREVFPARRWIVRAGAPWRLLPPTCPPWPVVYQQTRRWLEAGGFEALVHDLRRLLRLAQGRAGPRRPALGGDPGRAGRGCCSRVRRAGRARAITGTSGAQAPRCLRRWTRWASAWR